MQNGDRVQFVSCPELPAVTDSATFYYLQDTDKLYLGSQLIANNVKDVQNSETPGKLRIIQFDGSTREIDIPGNAFGIDCYKGKLPLDFTSPNGVIDEWRIYGNSSGPTEVLETQSTLPVNIDTYGGNAVDWEIYGNNNPVVESKTGDLPIEVSATAGNAVDWVIEGNDDNGTENLFDGTYNQALINPNTEQYLTIPICRTAVIACSPNTTYTVSMWDGCNRLIIVDTDTYPENHTHVNNINNYGVDIPPYVTVTTGANAHYLAAYVSNQSNTPSITIVKGSTAPDHYIPYQKGVGERTENVCTAPTAQTKTSGALSVTTDGQGRYDISISANISTQTEVSFDLPEFTMPISAGQGGNGTFSMFNTVKSGVYVAFYNNDTQIEYWILNSENRQTSTYISMGNKVCNKIVFRTNGSVYVGTARCAIMFTDDSTLPTTYTPYGYQIPLTISQQGETDKNYDIYIGDSPLTEGETVSKTSTGVDIELFEGENTVSTTLYNKPNTSITYNSSVLGVGERTEITGELPIDFRSDGDDLLGYRIYGTADGAGVQTPYGYKIPLTVTNSIETKTTDVYIGDRKLGEAEYVDYGEQKIYRRILFMTHDDKQFITKDNKDFCLRRRGYSG